MEEREKIINDFSKVISYSQGITNPKCEEIIDKLFEAKKDFIDNFGGLIFEVPEEISFELGENEKKNKILDFCDSIESKYSNYDLSNFIYEQRNWFFNNRVGRKYVTKNGDIIPEGMKLLKAFKFFEDDDYLLKKIQNEASAVIQEDKISGTLCFSVHPLDFLSSSENNHKWRSCHALDGEYRAGNLSYMVDEHTFMCYLKSDEETILPNFPEDVPWNNKKWRTLMFLSDYRDMMFAGRQYPFFSESGIDYVRNLMEKYFPKLGRWTEWKKDKIRSYNTGFEPISLTSPYIGVGNKLIPMRTLIKDADQTYPLHFNDLLKSSCYDPMYSYQIKNTFFPYNGQLRESISTLSGTRFVIGGKVNCLCCGKEPITMSEIMTCTNCELEYGNSDSDVFDFCPICGRRFVVEQGVYVDLHFETVCDQCGTEVEMCENCGNTGYRGTDIIYDREEHCYLCSRCTGE